MGYGLLPRRAVCSHFGEMWINLTAVLFCSHWNQNVNDVAIISKSYPDTTMLFSDWLFGSLIFYLIALQGLLNSVGNSLDSSNSGSTWWALSWKFLCVRNTRCGVWAGWNACLTPNAWDLRALCQCNVRCVQHRVAVVFLCSWAHGWINPVNRLKSTNHHQILLLQVSVNAVSTCFITLIIE